MEYTFQVCSIFFVLKSRVSILTPWPSLSRCIGTWRRGWGMGQAGNRFAILRVSGCKQFLKHGIREILKFSEFCF